MFSFIVMLAFLVMAVMGEIELTVVGGDTPYTSSLDHAVIEAPEESIRMDTIDSEDEEEDAEGEIKGSVSGGDPTYYELSEIENEDIPVHIISSDAEVRDAARELLAILEDSDNVFDGIPMYIIDGDDEEELKAVLKSILDQ